MAESMVLARERRVQAALFTAESMVLACERRVEAALLDSRINGFSL